MATKDELFASRFFKGDGFKRPLDVEIQKGVVEKLKNAEGVTKEKLVLFFVGEVKKAPAPARKKTATPSDDIEIDNAPSISDEELSQMAKESAERSDDDYVF